MRGGRGLTHPLKCPAIPQDPHLAASENAPLACRRAPFPTQMRTPLSSGSFPRRRDPVRRQDLSMRKLGTPARRSGFSSPNANVRRQQAGSTASMAHEVNQPISGIIMNAGTLRFTAARGPVATAFLFKRARRSWKFAQRQPTFGATNLALLFAKLPQISPCESRIHGFETRADFLAGRFDARIVNAVRGLSSVGRAPQWH